MRKFLTVFLEYWNTLQIQQPLYIHRLPDTNSDVEFYVLDLLPSVAPSPVFGEYDDNVWNVTISAISRNLGELTIVDLWDALDSKFRESGEYQSGLTTLKIAVKQSVNATTKEEDVFKMSIEVEIEEET